jgi:hypothetical protein
VKGRPGGWVDGIGWVALLHDLSRGDLFQFSPGTGRNTYTDTWERTPSNVPVIVACWSNGELPSEQGMEAS